MAHIKVDRGLDVPISGKPEGEAQPFVPGGKADTPEKPRQISLDLDPFEGIRFKLLAKKGDSIKLGEPLVEDKLTPGRVFASPAGGVITEIRRGLKRRLIDIVIDVAEKEEGYALDTLDPKGASREELIETMLKGGIFAHIRSRPFNFLADPKKEPRSIFVKAVETAPFVPPAEMQVKGYEKDFQTGLEALAKLTSGKVHLVYKKGSEFEPFTKAEHAEKHTVEGPHPAANPSVHIQEIDPIRSAEDVIWALDAHDVVILGHLLNTGKYLTERVVAIAGPAVVKGRTGYFKLRAGYPVELLISDRVKKGLVRFVSGDPLTGHKVEPEDFLGFQDYVLTMIPESVEREFMHFFRLGVDKYSFSGAYLSGHLNARKEYPFTTNQHGEHRAFMDPALYDKVMPIKVPAMQLVKAVMAEDYDLAEELGLLDVVEEDFALPTFVDPSKVEMSAIIKEGLRAHAAEVIE